MGSSRRRRPSGSPGLSIVLGGRRASTVQRSRVAGGGFITRVFDGPSVTLLFRGDTSQTDAQDDGPSTVLHLGGAVYLDRLGTGAFDELVSAEGPSRDICAELSS